MITTRVSQLSRASCNSAVKLYHDSLKPESKLMIDGTVYHSIVLENKLPDNLDVIYGYKTFQSNEASKLRDASIKNGKIPVLESSLEEYINKGKQLKHVRALFKGCEVEVQSPLLKYKNLFMFSGKCDARHTLNKETIDLKFTNIKSFDNLYKFVYYNGYDVQLYLYNLINGYDKGRIVMVNVDTLAVQQITMEQDMLKVSCVDRIENVAYPRLLQLEKFKKGDYMLPDYYYYPQE